jgi:hypothetical protein
MKNLYFLFILFFISLDGKTQVFQTLRYEKQDKFRDEEYSVISMKEDGLGLIRGTKKYKSGSRTWEILLLDTALSEKTQLELDIESQFELIGYEHSPGNLHVLFMKNQYVGELFLVSIQLSSQIISTNKIKPELNFKLTHFGKVGSSFVFGGFVNTEPCVLMFFVSNEKIKMIPGFFQKETELIDLRINANQTFSTIIIDRGLKDQRKLLTRIFDQNGVQLLEDFTLIEEDITIQNGISSSLVREELIVFGTWSKKNSRPSSGFYALTVNPFANDTLIPIYFGLLDHYLDYLRSRRIAKIKLKTQLAIAKNKIPDFTNYALPYKIIEHSQGFLVLAETFSPQSSYQPTYGNYQTTPAYDPSNYYPYYGSYSPYYNRRFSPAAYGANIATSEELKKTQIVVLNINPSKGVTWDYSLKVKDVKTENLGKISEVAITEDSVYMVYQKESELIIKSINLENGESIQAKQKIKTLNEYDEIRSERKPFGLIECWYNNTFYIWGYQSIRNKLEKDRTKEVFYINKIIVQ